MTANCITYFLDYPYGEEFDMEDNMPQVRKKDWLMLHLHRQQFSGCLTILDVCFLDGNVGVIHSMNKRRKLNKPLPGKGRSVLISQPRGKGP